MCPPALSRQNSWISPSALHMAARPSAAEGKGRRCQGVQAVAAAVFVLGRSVTSWVLAHTAPSWSLAITTYAAFASTVTATAGRALCRAGMAVQPDHVWSAVLYLLK